MEVTKENFQELLPDIQATINGSDFLCVDGEFTGLNYGNNITSYDLPEEYYAKLYSGAMDFLLVQFGLAAFTEEKETGSYRCKVYNFYAFPKPLNRSAPDSRFVCQSSSLDFLASKGFDFNKLFTNGIPYLTQSDEVNLKEVMAEKRRYQAANNSTPIPVPILHKQQVDDACDKIKELLDPDFKEEEVNIDKCNGFVRKLIYQTVRERFPSGNIVLELKNGVLVARRRDTPLNREEEEREAMEKDIREVDDAVGFSKVIRAISASEKLIVGHNMLLDVCHMIHHFCDRLPEDYPRFKEMAHFIFPKLIDTKFMCSAEPLKDLISSSVLENMSLAIKEKPFVQPELNTEEGYGYEMGSEKYHEAGYDAYVTGVCFLSFLKYLESRDNAPKDLSVLKPYLNKLYLMRTPDTYINLQDDDPVVSRDHVFHVTFPKVWTNNNLAKLFRAYGTVQISWLNDTSAWVALYNKQERRKVTKAMCCQGASLPKGVVVRTYDGYRAARSAVKPDKRKSPEAAPTPPANVKTPANLKRRKTTESKAWTFATSDWLVWFCVGGFILAWLAQWNGFVVTDAQAAPETKQEVPSREKCIEDLEKAVVDSTSDATGTFAVDTVWG